MAFFSIQARKIASGESRYKATVTIKRGGEILQRFAKTFKKKAHATTWAKQQVAEIETNGVNKLKATSIGELLDRSMNDAHL